jgi:hypothetical protein
LDQKNTFEYLKKEETEKLWQLREADGSQQQFGSQLSVQNVCVCAEEVTESNNTHPPVEDNNSFKVI